MAAGEVGVLAVDGALEPLDQVELGGGRGRLDARAFADHDRASQVVLGFVPLLRVLRDERLRIGRAVFLGDAFGRRRRHTWSSGSRCGGRPGGRPGPGRWRRRPSRPDQDRHHPADLAQAGEALETQQNYEDDQHRQQEQPESATTADPRSRVRVKFRQQVHHPVSPPSSRLIASESEPLDAMIIRVDDPRRLAPAIDGQGPRVVKLAVALVPTPPSTPSEACRRA